MHAIALITLAFGLNLLILSRLLCGNHSFEPSLNLFFKSEFHIEGMPELITRISTFHFPPRQTETSECC